ncbi:MAG: T9SS type A sorting domain-containing protein [Flavobacteriales bacterium]|nr:T9SS type A sorting domain-containing protein [Flavobacteriales bacterium]
MLIDVTVQGSYDPNVKTVEPRDVYLIDQDSTLTYTICFQNTGTDTAFTVVVTDTLDALLDIGTLQLLGASHAYIPQLDDPRVLRFTFNNINLPDSGTNETLSHGALSFRIRPHASLQPGDVISNTANIFFDLNPPVITAPSVLVAEFSTDVQGQEQGQVILAPNPASDRITITSPIELRSVKLFSPDGRVIQQQRVGASVVTLDIAGLAGGSYVVEITDRNGRVLRDRFIKQ